jgi:formylglycine-generating enzyme required for sulfatase activity
MVQINHGSFSMGSPSNEVGRQSNETQHQVTLTQDFMVMTTEVTQSMFFQLMGYHGYQGRRGSYDWGSGSDYPVYYTSWDMAADFANAVTQQQNALLGLNMQECYVCSNPGVAAVACVQAMNPYQCDGYRLLTEAEWEYSARAGSTAAIWTANGGANLTNTVSSNYTTSDGFDLRTYAWHTNNAGGTTRPVAQKMDNSWGLYDMSGNVWEWVHDYDATLSTSSMTDPVTETATGGSRIRRGGQFGSAPYDLRSAKRGGEAQTGRQNYMGFRLARFP